MTRQSYKNFCLALTALFVIALLVPALTWGEDGMLQDQDNIEEQRGPGNMDVPLEKAPSPSPSPKPQAEEEKK